MDFNDQDRKKALKKGDGKYFFIRSFAKGMNVLELLSENESLTVSQVAKLMTINRASSHRFLSTLKELGYADKDDSSRYFLTSKVIELGMKVLDRFEIRKIARPFLQELSAKFNETINLGYFNGEEVLTIDKIDSTEILRMDAGIGGGEPAYCTSLGKAILAFLPDMQLKEYLQTIELTPFTPNTVISKDKLKKELLQIKENGYSIDDEELSVGLRCVGAPLFNHSGQALYAISLSGPSIRMGSKRIEEMQRALKKICQNLSGKMGNHYF
ncbi:Transcriptional regulator, IclR family [Olavius sp. associated proteobacterium Delta 1]|nr:Transcriptional regulator, IclR family [Olavius sp. associated proteobacterium Delta 1]